MHKIVEISAIAIADIVRQSEVSSHKQASSRYSPQHAAEPQVPGAKGKNRLQKSFLKHDLNEPFSEEQINYSAEDSYDNSYPYGNRSDKAAPVNSFTPRQAEYNAADGE